jgi:hypothetical protein
MIDPFSIFGINYLTLVWTTLSVVAFDTFCLQEITAKVRNIKIPGTQYFFIGAWLIPL